MYNLFIIKPNLYIEGTGQRQRPRPFFGHTDLSAVSPVELSLVPSVIYKIFNLRILLVLAILPYTDPVSSRHIGIIDLFSTFKRQRSFTEVHRIPFKAGVQEDPGLLYIL